MSYNINLQHIVFRTHLSRFTIPNDKRKGQILAYINSESQRLGAVVYAINAHLNHVHLLVDIGASIKIENLLATIKANSSRVFQRHDEFPLFEGWAKKYGSFSISRWDKDKITKYIENQEEHHKCKTLAEELVELFGEDVAADKWWCHDWLDE